MDVSDWDPQRYAAFGDLRLRRALDLLAQVQHLPDGMLVDLGCGAGAVGSALAARYPQRKVIGLDSSPAMLAEAADAGAYHELIQTDISEWQPNEPPALIFSNAALIWVQGHDVPLPKPAGMLAPGVVLAAQMPRQWGLPRTARSARLPKTCFGNACWTFLKPLSMRPLAYWHILSAMGQVSVWETDYVQRLERGLDCHPVRAFTQSTALRPFLDRITKVEVGTF